MTAHEEDPTEGKAAAEQPVSIKLDNGDVQVVETLLERIRKDYEKLGRMEHEYLQTRAAGHQSVLGAQQELTAILLSLQTRYLSGAPGEYAYNAGRLVLSRKP